MEKTNDEVIDLMELFYALKKRILIILAVMVVGAVAAGAYTKLLVTPMYSATSTILVLTKETTLSSIADLQMGSQLTQDYSILLTSRTVMQDVIDNLDLDMNYQQLKGSITIDYPQNTRIMKITVTNADPKMAKEIVDEVAEVGAQFIGDQMEVVPPKIIEKGEVPTGPDGPNTKRNVMMGALAGLVLSAGVVVLITLIDDTVKTEDDIERYLGISTLASIPDRKDYITGKSKKKSKKKRRRRKKK